MVQVHLDELVLGEEPLVEVDKLADDAIELDGDLDHGPHDLVVQVHVDELVLGQELLV